MHSQLKLILFLLNLFVGSWVIGFVYFRFRLYCSQYLKKVLQYIIILNVILLSIFFLKYFDINIWRQELSFRSSVFLPYALAIFFLAFYFLVFSMFEIFYAFSCKDLKRKTKFFSISAITLFTAAIFIGLNFAVVHPGLRFFFTVADNLIGILFLLEILILIRIFIQKDALCISTKITKSFSIIYLLRYPIVFVFSLAIFEPIGSSVAILLIHLLTIFWIKVFVDRIERESVDSKKDNIEQIEVAKKFNLSKRETEIFLLVIQGKNNREIQDELFISYHTVKNHIYNIFRKMNVKNRYQLINLISQENNQRLNPV